MADRCIDGTLTTGTEAGTVAGAAPTDGEWANAAHAEANIQGAYDQLVAGDTLHATRTQTLTAPIDIDQASGSGGSMIKVLGYNYNAGSPIADGTKYVIDANSAAANCIDIADKDFWVFENVEFKNATADNVTGSVASPRSCTFKNCTSHDAGGDGWGNSGGAPLLVSRFILCQAYNNVNGYAITTLGRFLFCTAHTNSAIGFNTYGGAYFGCVAYDNSISFRDQSIENGIFFNCASDDATSAHFSCLSFGAIVAGCRMTGTGTGILGSGTQDVLDLWNFNNCGTKTNNITVDQQIKGVDTRIETGVEGYIDAAGGNYGLTNSAAARRTAVAL